MRCSASEIIIHWMLIYNLLLKNSIAPRIYFRNSHTPVTDVLIDSICWGAVIKIEIRKPISLKNWSGKHWLMYPPNVHFQPQQSCHACSDIGHRSSKQRRHSSFRNTNAPSSKWVTECKSHNQPQFFLSILSKGLFTDVVHSFFRPSQTWPWH